MKIGVIGSGDVAKTLGGGFLKHGHEVAMGTRDPAKLADWAKAHPRSRIGTFAEAAKFGQVVVLAVKGTVAADALRLAGAVNLAGKTVIDATNPIADAPPVNGVVSYFTTSTSKLTPYRNKTVAPKWRRILEKRLGHGIPSPSVRPQLVAPRGPKSGGGWR